MNPQEALGVHAPLTVLSCSPSRFESQSPFCAGTEMKLLYTCLNKYYHISSSFLSEEITVYLMILLHPNTHLWMLKDESNFLLSLCLHRFRKYSQQCVRGLSQQRKSPHCLWTNWWPNLADNQSTYIHKVKKNNVELSFTTKMSDSFIVLKHFLIMTG